MNKRLKTQKNANKRKRLEVKGFDVAPKRIRLTYTPVLTAYITEKARALESSFSHREIASILKVGRNFINRILR